MNEKSDKIKKILLMTTLIASSIAIMCDMVIIPVAENIYMEYAAAPIGVLNYILSGTSLISAISSLAFGFLMRKYGKKNMFFMAFFIYTVGTVCCGFVLNAYYMAVMRTLAGIGMGGCTVGGVAIISDVFADEQRRSSMIGLYNGGMSMLGAVLGWTAGIAAMTGWQNVYKIYWIALPICVAILLFVPKDKTEQEAEITTETEKIGKFPFRNTLLLNGAAFITNMVYCIVYYQVSMVAVEKGITNSSTIGMFSAINTIGCFCAGLLFGFLYSKLKNFLPAMGYAIITIGFLTLYVSGTGLVIMIACALIGVAYGILLTHYYMECTVLVPAEWTTISTSITVMIVSIGSFLSTYFTTGLMALLQKETITSLIPLTIVILAAATVLSVVFAMKAKRNAS